MSYSLSLFCIFCVLSISSISFIETLSLTSTYKKVYLLDSGKPMKDVYIFNMPESFGNLKLDYNTRFDQYLNLFSSVEAPHARYVSKNLKCPEFSAYFLTPSGLRFRNGSYTDLSLLPANTGLIISEPAYANFLTLRIGDVLSYSAVPAYEKWDGRDILKVAGPALVKTKYVKITGVPMDHGKLPDCSTSGDEDYYYNKPFYNTTINGEKYVEIPPNVIATIYFAKDNVHKNSSIHYTREWVIWSDYFVSYCSANKHIFDVPNVNGHRTVTAEISSNLVAGLTRPLYDGIGQSQLSTADFKYHMDIFGVHIIIKLPKIPESPDCPLASRESLEATWADKKLTRTEIEDDLLSVGQESKRVKRNKLAWFTKGCGKNSCGWNGVIQCSFACTASHVPLGGFLNNVIGADCHPSTCPLKSKVIRDLQNITKTLQDMTSMNHEQLLNVSLRLMSFSTVDSKQSGISYASQLIVNAFMNKTEQSISKLNDLSIDNSHQLRLIQKEVLEQAKYISVTRTNAENVKRLFHINELMKNAEVIISQKVSANLNKINENDRDIHGIKQSLATDKERIARLNQTLITNKERVTQLLVGYRSTGERIDQLETQAFVNSLSAVKIQIDDQIRKCRENGAVSFSKDIMVTKSNVAVVITCTMELSLGSYLGNEVDCRLHSLCFRNRLIVHKGVCIRTEGGVVVYGKKSGATGTVAYVGHVDLKWDPVLIGTCPVVIEDQLETFYPRDTIVDAKMIPQGSRFEKAYETRTQYYRYSDYAVQAINSALEGWIQKQVDSSKGIENLKTGVYASGHISAFTKIFRNTVVTKIKSVSSDEDSKFNFIFPGRDGSAKARQNEKNKDNRRSRRSIECKLSLSKDDFENDDLDCAPEPRSRIRVLKRRVKKDINDPTSDNLAGIFDELDKEFKLTKKDVEVTNLEIKINASQTILSGLQQQLAAGENSTELDRNVLITLIKNQKETIRNHEETLAKLREVTSEEQELANKIGNDTTAENRKTSEFFKKANEQIDAEEADIDKLLKERDEDSGNWSDSSKAFDAILLVLIAGAYALIIFFHVCKGDYLCDGVWDLSGRDRNLVALYTGIFCEVAVYMFILYKSARKGIRQTSTIGLSKSYIALLEDKVIKLTQELKEVKSLATRYATPIVNTGLALTCSHFCFENNETLRGEIACADKYDDTLTGLQTAQMTLSLLGLTYMVGVMTGKSDAHPKMAIFENAGFTLAMSYTVFPENFGLLNHLLYISTGAISYVFMFLFLYRSRLIRSEETAILLCSIYSMVISTSMAGGGSGSFLVVGFLNLITIAYLSVCEQSRYSECLRTIKAEEENEDAYHEKLALQLEENRERYMGAYQEKVCVNSDYRDAGAFQALMIIAKSELEEGTYLKLRYEVFYTTTYNESLRKKYFAIWKDLVSLCSSLKDAIACVNDYMDLEMAEIQEESGNRKPIRTVYESKGLPVYAGAVFKCLEKLRKLSCHAHGVIEDSDDKIMICEDSGLHEHFPDRTYPREEATKVDIIDKCMKYNQDGMVCIRDLCIMSLILYFTCHYASSSLLNVDPLGFMILFAILSLIIFALALGCGIALAKVLKMRAIYVGRLGAMRPCEYGNHHSTNCNTMNCADAADDRLKRRDKDSKSRFFLASKCLVICIVVFCISNYIPKGHAIPTALSTSTATTTERSGDSETLDDALAPFKRFLHDSETDVLIISFFITLFMMITVFFIVTLCCIRHVRNQIIRNNNMCSSSGVIQSCSTTMGNYDSLEVQLYLKLGQTNPAIRFNAAAVTDIERVKSKPWFIEKRGLKIYLSTFSRKKCGISGDNIRRDMFGSSRTHVTRCHLMTCKGPYESLKGANVVKAEMSYQGIDLRIEVTILGRELKPSDAVSRSLTGEHDRDSLDDHPSSQINQTESG